MNESDVEEITQQLKDVGSGIDGINSKLFKSSYKPILSKLTYFFNLCLSTGVFPNPLKIAVVKPIFKSGDCHSLSNYRPISVLPFISKNLEKIVCYQLYAFISKSQLLTDRQFGFRNNHSTCMPIMLIQYLITTGIENGEYVVGLYLDLCKAFDTVDHNILLKKLNQCGIRGHALDKFKSYLTNRKQTLSVDGAKASLRNINSEYHRDRSWGFFCSLCT